MCTYGNGAQAPSLLQTDAAPSVLSVADARVKSTLNAKPQVCTLTKEKVEEDDKKKKRCFPALATVRRVDGSRVRMDALEVGDVIQTAEGYSQVYAWLHREDDPDEVDVSYLEIATETALLRVTREHLVYVNSRPVQARTIRVGDNIWVQETGPALVLSVAEARHRGAYAPLTRSGSLLVDDVQVSAYALSHGGLRWGETVLVSGHSLAHVGFASLRWATAMWPRLGADDMHDGKSGQHVWAGWLNAQGLAIGARERKDALDVRGGLLSVGLLTFVVASASRVRAY